MPSLMARKGIEVACYFEPQKPTLPEADSFLRLNYEGFFFCNAAERERFEMDPVTYCGLLTDPVSKRRFRPSTESPFVVHEGVLYLFQGADTALAFASSPGDYRLPGYEMEEEGEEAG